MIRFRQGLHCGVRREKEREREKVELMENGDNLTGSRVKEQFRERRRRNLFSLVARLTSIPYIF